MAVGKRTDWRRPRMRVEKPIRGTMVETGLKEMVEMLTKGYI